MKKKMGIVLCLFILVFSLTACSSSKDNPLHLGVNAVITGIDVTNKTLTVEDSAEEGVLGGKCLIDCSSIPMIYCNYHTQQVVSISFEDLQVNDEILLSIRSSEIEKFQNKDNEESTIRVEQLQLGTQRIK